MSKKDLGFIKPTSELSEILKVLNRIEHRLEWLEIDSKNRENNLIPVENISFKDIRP